MSAWLETEASEEDAPVAEDPVLGAALESRGVGLLDPFTAGAVPVPAVGGRAFLLGAVGGVGVTSLARLAGPGVGEGIDPERLRGLVGVDVDSGFWGGIPFGAPAWVVSRVERGSLEAAQALASRHSQGLVPVTVAGLVLTYPPYRPDAREVQQARAVSRLYPRTLGFPWVEDIAALAADALPGRARNALAAVQESAVEDGTATEGEK